MRLGIEQGGADVAAGSECDLLSGVGIDSEPLGEQRRDLVLGRVRDVVLHPAGLEAFAHVLDVEIAGGDEGAPRAQFVGVFEQHHLGVIRALVEFVDEADLIAEEAPHAQSGHPAPDFLDADLLAALAIDIGGMTGELRGEPRRERGLASAGRAVEEDADGMLG